MLSDSIELSMVETNAAADERTKEGKDSMHLRMRKYSAILDLNDQDLLEVHPCLASKPIILVVAEVALCVATGVAEVDSKVTAGLDTVCFLWVSMALEVSPEVWEEPEIEVLWATVDLSAKRSSLAWTSITGSQLRSLKREGLELPGIRDSIRLKRRKGRNGIGHVRFIVIIINKDSRGKERILFLVTYDAEERWRWSTERNGSTVDMTLLFCKEKEARIPGPNV